MLKPPKNKLETRTANLWLADVNSIKDKEIPFYLSFLSSCEASRYTRFARRERQRQFLVGRILLRMAVARLLGLYAIEVGLIEQAGNAPLLVLEGNLTTPGFSISHSREWVACIVSSNTLLGLDIEVIDPARDPLKLGSLAFNAEQYSWLQLQPESERLSAFYQLWSRKEALFKLKSALGKENAFSLSDKIDQNKQQCNWHFQSLHYAELSIAICSRKQISSINYYEWDGRKLNES